MRHFTVIAIAICTLHSAALAQDAGPQPDWKTPTVVQLFYAPVWAKFPSLPNGSPAAVTPSGVGAGVQQFLVPFVSADAAFDWHWLRVGQQRNTQYGVLNLGGSFHPLGDPSGLRAFDLFVGSGYAENFPRHFGLTNGSPQPERGGAYYLQPGFQWWYRDGLAIFFAYNYERHGSDRAREVRVGVSLR